MLVAITILCVASVTYIVIDKGRPAVDLPTLSLRGGDANASTEFLNAQRSVEYYREEIRQHPERVKNYVELAQLFLQEARVTGRHHEYLPKAQYLVDQALRLEPQNYDGMVVKATILMTRHHFTEAKELAESAVQRQPHSAGGYGILCDAHVELGNYEEAVTTCDKMLSVRPDLRSYARASYLRELHGDIIGAIEAMKMAADAGIIGQENRAWALYNLGKLFLNEGKIDTAAYIFKGILEERPDFSYALSGLAQVKRAQGNTQEAVALLSKASQLTPDHLFIEQLADLYRSSGQEEQAAGVANIVLEMFDQHEKDGWNVNREYAMFCANHEMNLKDALERAEKEYRERPRNVDVLETYAWVLYKNGKASEGVPIIEQALRLDSKSYVLAYHSARIYQAAGQSENAKKYFEIARNQNRFVEVLITDGSGSHRTGRQTASSME